MLIKNISILFIFILIASCSSKNNNDPGMDSMLRLLPNEELPVLLTDYINGQKNLRIKESSDSSRFIKLYKKEKERTETVYVILHTDDSLHINYISIIDHDVYNANYCCTEYNESNCSLTVYQIKDDSVININNQALPKLSNQSRSLENAFLEGRLKSGYISPSVFTDSIVFTNNNNKLQTILVWKQNKYKILDKKDMNYNSFFSKNFYLEDTLLIESLVNLNNAIKDSDLEALNHLIKFPVEVIIESGSANRHINDIEKLYDEFLYDMASANVLGSEIETLKREKGNKKFSWTTNKEYTNAECKKTLTYKPGAVQISDFIYDYTFIKDCDSYKLVAIDYWSIGYD